MTLARFSGIEDGRKLYVDFGFAMPKDPSGAVVGAMATGREATERYLAERERRLRAPGS